MMKVALVYDRVNKWGGAERVLLVLHKIWPEAPLYTSVYDPKAAPWAKVFEVRTSFLQKLPFLRRHHEWLAWLMPLAFESFNFDEFDLVISVTSEAAKGIVTKPKTKHLCYCLTPTRYLWSSYEEYFRNKWFKFLAKPMVSYLKKWDLVACQRPDRYLAISKTVLERIKKYYGREGEVVYPPVDLNKFKITNQNSKFFLVVSRLVPYKKVDIVVQAFSQLGWNLKIVGVGSKMKKLKRMAKENIEFLGQLTDEELVGYYQNCQAVIFPQEEDFGIVPLETQACGKPVIAFRGGGATETVIDGKTGLFFYPQTVKSLVRVLREFGGDEGKFKAEDCRKQAEKFSEERFLKEFMKGVSDGVTRVK